jgi:hypothetical protein
VTAAAESILLRRSIIFSGTVVHRFAFGIRFDSLFTERCPTAHEIRAILSHFDLRVMAFNSFHGPFHSC